MCRWRRRSRRINSDAGRVLERNLASLTGGHPIQIFEWNAGFIETILSCGDLQLICGINRAGDDRVIDYLEIMTSG